ncbi:transcriptional regulator, MucR family [Desulfocurvibacter africanus PCS]|uniref:Transcriptional regulator, MucR family n=1 Tax=Desulfocurvibacter africanus PCS TaxID=1262666 RepID=M5Q0Z2_DESAF|nr:MucR family transcriptional regulator [Desulfocurvibacter africanus]EMG36098.1 transcriptional regulator, MucR family [Desulfocurvibacter africanus PCS]
MGDALKEALEIVAAQARVRNMTEDEIVAMTKSLVTSLNQILRESSTDSTQNQEPVIDPAKHRREKSITCLECGKNFKSITSRHLKLHGLDKKSYLAKWDLPKGTSLACKALARERRGRIKDMKLWNYRGKVDSKNPDAL